MIEEREQRRMLSGGCQCAFLIPGSISGVAGTTETLVEVEDGPEDWPDSACSKVEPAANLHSYNSRHSA